MLYLKLKKKSFFFRSNRIGAPRLLFSPPFCALEFISKKIKRSHLMPTFFLIIITFLLLVEGQVPDEQSQALIALYSSTSGPSWKINSNWLVDDPCLNAWYGVGCDNNNSNVISLTFEWNSLYGSLPSELGLLSQLTSLDFEGNSINGTLPTELFSLSDLAYLDFEVNSLVGTLPSELSLLSQVTVITVNHNSFSGSIPTELGLLSTLVRFEADDNTLIGSLPSEICKLPQLKSLNLAANQFIGTIPTEIGGMPSLLYLYLPYNSLSGPIPTELGNLSRLKRLGLGNNFLSGSIPTELGNMNATEFNYLGIYSNSLVGSIPTELVRLTALWELSVKNNFLSGVIPLGLGNAHMPLLTSIQLSSNALIGTIPSDFGKAPLLGNIQLQNNFFSGTISPSLCGRKLEYLVLQNNSFTGTIPDLDSCLKLSLLVLSVNSFEGTIPDSLWLPTLKRVALSANDLTGTLSAALSHSPTLQTLQIDNNYLSGTLPQTLLNTSLSTLSAGGNNFNGTLNWLRFNKHFEILLLGNNSFSGFADSWVCDQNSTSIYLAGNDLICPSSCPSNCNPCYQYCADQSLPQTQVLSDLYLSTGGPSWNRKSNWLSIKPCVEVLLPVNDNNCLSQWEGVTCFCDYSPDGESFQVIGLSLSDNHLTGTLPESMVNLTALTSVDFSENSLTGKLGDWVCGLSSFDLMGNNFFCPLPECCSTRNGNMCAPCHLTQRVVIKIEIIVGVVGLITLICVGVAYLIHRKRLELRAFILVDEDESLVPFLKPTPGGPIETPHPDLFWWKDAKRTGGVSVEDVTSQYRLMCQTLIESLGDTRLEVVRVLHTENPFLWRQYNEAHSNIKAHLPQHIFDSPNSNAIQLMKNSDRQLFESVVPKNHRQWMEEKLHLDVEGRELLLFHGSQRQYADLIFHQGFDSRVGSLQGQYGAGCYFAEDIQKATQYMSPDENGVMYLFLARVSIGFPYFSNSSMKFARRAPMMKKSERVCDSVIGTRDGKHREFVVYDRNQCYPELLIELRKKGSSSSQPLLSFA